MKIEDLRPGDVLLLAGEEGSVLSKLIMLLTGAPVSHAAITYRDNTELIEESPPDLHISNIQERRAGRKIWVKRLKGAHNLGPVLDAGESYLDEGEPYAMSNLYMVGMILLFRKFTPNSWQQKAMIAAFKYLAGEVLEFINQRKSPGKLPMICSQFVFQCFKDAGEGYHLEIPEPLLQLPAPGEPAPVPSLLDQVDTHIRSGEAGELLERPAILGVEVSARSEDEILQQLLDAFQPLDGERDTAVEGEGIYDRDTLESASEDNLLQAELVLAVNQFAEGVAQAKTGRPEPPQALQSALQARQSPNALTLLQAEESTFVTPADLFNRCINLEQVGAIE